MIDTITILGSKSFSFIIVKSIGIVINELDSECDEASLHETQPYIVP